MPLPSFATDADETAPGALTPSQPGFGDVGNSGGSGMLDPNVGQIFGGKYVIEGILGEGGMGIVYRARHHAIGKRFAIKLLRGEAVKDPEVVERFKQEAQAASAIGSEHIVDITDFAERPDGSTYFVMEMLDGKSLGKLFEELARVPTARLVRIAKQIARGLGAAHEAGIVHRDLKPDNVYLCKRSGGETDFVKILDFGIAKVGAGGSKLTRAGAVFGTPHYMSPEQAAGASVDQRTDIYAMGVILYEGGVGRVPFDADNFMGILTSHMYKAPVPPRAHPECPPDLPAGLEVVIMRCLRKKPEERYASMQELEADLERLERGEIPNAARDMMALSAGYQSLAASALAAGGMPRPIPAEPPAPAKAKSRWPMVAGLAGVGAVVAIATAALIGPSKTTAGTTSTAPASIATSPAAPRPTEAPIVATKPASDLPAKKTRSVLIASEPAPNAKVYDGDTLLGETPLVLELEQGATRSLALKAPGFADRALALDDKVPAKVVVALKYAPGGGGAVRAAPRRPTGGVTDPEDPWGKR